jgi:hypothetical protein
MSNESQKPSKVAVHILFWAAHILIAASILSIDSNGPSEDFQIGFALLPLGILVIFCYFFAIGRFAKKLNRSAIVWGGLSFVLSPFGIWISYIASFFVSPKEVKQ